MNSLGIGEGEVAGRDKEVDLEASGKGGGTVEEEEG